RRQAVENTLHILSSRESAEPVRNEMCVEGSLPRSEPIRANLRTSERGVTDVRTRVSAPLPPSAENVMSPLQRGRPRSGRGSLTHAHAGVPIRSQFAKLARMGLRRGYVFTPLRGWNSTEIPELSKRPFVGLSQAICR